MANTPMDKLQTVPVFTGIVSLLYKEKLMSLE